jgi:uncharacterized protein YhaN
MRLLRLHLKAFGPFTDQVLELGDGRGLVLVHGPNEAGKSSALRAMIDLRFGIPQQSPDNFVHPHPAMRIGGEFIDRHGQRHALMRRKGRIDTLSLVDFSDPDAPPLASAPPELEAMLGGGLRRDDYLAGFAIDLERLRAGGNALLRGQGEVGAALFQASAGAQEIGRVRDQLEQASRALFVPGTRGRNGRINEALRAFAAHRDAFRNAQVTPANWARLSAAHQAAAGKLTELETLRQDLEGRLGRIGEQRAVATLLATLDQAQALLDQLQDAPALPEDAPGQRSAAEAGLAAARLEADEAAAEAGRLERRLAGLALDRAILELAQAVRRLLAEAEAIDGYRATLARAEADVAAGLQGLARLARDLSRPGPGIDALLAEPAGPAVDCTGLAAAMLERAPSPTRRAAIDEAVQALDHATRALAQHRQAVAEADPLPDVDEAALPSPVLRTALRLAQTEAATGEAVVQRLASLPAEIEAIRRALAAGLADIGLPDPAALRRARPLLDARIDDELDAERRSATRREEREQRLAAATQAHDGELARRAALLAQGPLPTRTELAAARSRRDTGWTLVRGTYIDGGAPPAGDFAGELPLPLAYEQAVLHADTLADALAAGHERAARLDGSSAELARLATEIDSLKRQLADIAREDSGRRGRWQATLSEAGLPTLPPAALRDWQARFLTLRATAETLQARLDEQAAAQAHADRQAAALRNAILAVGGADTAGAGATIATLAASAEALEAGFRAAEKQLDTVRGQRAQQARQRQQMAAQESRLAEAASAARAALAQALAELLLPADAGPAVIRARLAEFDALVAARDRTEAARSDAHQARAALDRLDQAGQALAAALGDPPPADLRLWLSRLGARLDEAEAAAHEHALASQALASARAGLERHQATTARHAETLARLCALADVDSVAALPEAEHRAQRRREALADRDRTLGQLALVSRQPVEALREQLSGREPASFDADEQACRRTLAELDEALREARATEERTRHDLRAIDGADTAAAEREAMEQAAARIRGDLPVWIRSRLAQALLDEAMRRFRERAQGPMLRTASASLERMTGGRFVRLLADDSEPPTLLAERRTGERVGVTAMSEGSCDQLYLALRLAALQLQRQAGIDLPVVLDDVLMSSDDARAACMLETLADFAEDGQVIVFTHHAHLVALARRTLATGQLTVAELAGRGPPSDHG